MSCKLFNKSKIYEINKWTMKSNCSRGNEIRLGCALSNTREFSTTKDFFYYLFWNPYPPSPLWLLFSNLLRLLRIWEMKYFYPGLTPVCVLERSAWSDSVRKEKKRWREDRPNSQFWASGDLESWSLLSTIPHGWYIEVGII